MAPAKLPKDIGPLIDQIELIREELLTLQRSLEELEQVDALKHTRKEPLR